MSGGTFNHNQYIINQIAEEIQEHIDRQGNPIPPENSYYPQENQTYQTYPKEIHQELLNAVKALKIAYTYAQRVDYLLSHDDSESSFLTRLHDELSKIK